jgi:small multidrug resistance pump
MPIAWLALAATILCSAGGNAVANWSHHFVGRRLLLVLALACAVQGIGLVFFSVALTGIPLSLDYPLLIGGSMVLVTLLAAVWFKEHLSLRHIGGMVLIALGMVLLKSGDADAPAHAGALQTQAAAALSRPAAGAAGIAIGEGAP